jgi:hypothetical protein
MKFFIPLCFCLLFLSCFCKAQTGNISATDEKVNQKIHELKVKKIDTIVCYYTYCSGTEPRVGANDSCFANEIKYLFWYENNKCFIQRFDECSEHKQANIKATFLNLIRRRYSIIQDEEIKYPQYNGTIKEKTISNTLLQDHSCNIIFEIHTRHRVLRKDIDVFSLETRYFDNKHLNKNYSNNQQSILNKLKIIVEGDVSSYNKNP